MTTISKILVPVDFSEQSRLVLDYAAGLARLYGATLDIIHVWEPIVFPPSGLVPGDLENSVFQAAKATAEQMFESFRRSAVERGIPVGVAKTLQGSPAHTIVDHAKNEAYDLIVIGTHWRTGLSRAMIGSVAERVVRRAHCPVLTVRAQAAR